MEKLPENSFKKSPIFSCEKCQYTTAHKCDYNKHILTQKHTRKNPKNPNICRCDVCHYITDNTFDYNKHLLTNKHILKNRKKTSKYQCEKCQYITDNIKDYNKHFLTNKHEKNNNNESIQITQIAVDTSENTILEIIKQNQEFKQLIIEQNQEIKQLIGELVSKPTTINNNSHNKKFNLNFFLNEQCKDAMNITDFVSSINLQLTDLENTGKNGFVEGVSQMIIKNLKKLDVYKRPIHCSDAKRETMYVKDKNIWEKEKDEKVKIHKTIRQIAHKNTLQIPKWINEHPKCEDYYSKDNDQYLHIVSESMGGINDEETNKYYNKIIKNVSKEMVIEEET
jgi:hypothetical protein